MLWEINFYLNIVVPLMVLAYLSLMVYHQVYNGDLDRRLHRPAPRREAERCKDAEASWGLGDVFDTSRD